MRYDKIDPLNPENKSIRIVIETPKGSRHKYAYDPELKAFTLKKSLPEGMMFPFDFGFIPRTKGPDGDPLDVLVLADAALIMGCVVECRIVGLIEAEQTEGKEKERNDRFIAVANSSLEYKDVNDVEDLAPHVCQQTEQFFVSYNKMAGKKFRVVRLLNAKAAKKHLKQQIEKKL